MISVLEYFFKRFLFFQIQKVARILLEMILIVNLYVDSFDSGCHFLRLFVFNWFFTLVLARIFHGINFFSYSDGSWNAAVTA